MKSWFKKIDEQPVPEKDPVVNSSLAIPLAISSLLLMLSMVWAFYEEGWGLRPWRAYQAEFQQLYLDALEKKKPLSRQEQQAILASSGYQELEARLREAEEANASEMASIEAREREIFAMLEQEFLSGEKGWA